MAGLEWRPNLIGDLIAHIEEGLTGSFFRIAQFTDTRWDLWLVRRVDHPKGGVRQYIGQFQTVDDAELAAEEHCDQNNY